MPRHAHHWLYYALIAGSSVLSACNPATEQKAAERPPIPVFSQTVGVAKFATRIEALGTARANESVLVSANITKKLIELQVDDGRQVQQGDLLARLDDAAERAELGAAQARLAERRKALARTRTLVTERVLSESVIDLRAAEVQTAIADVAMIEASIADHRILAPFSGRLGLRRVSVGALIRPGDVITSLNDIEIIKVDFTVPETAVRELSPGVALQAKSAAYPELRFVGTVVAVDTQIDPVTRSITARASIRNEDHKLLPGMLITLELLASQRESLAVPEAALVPRGTRQFVFRIEDGKAQRVEVQLGTRNAEQAEITSGLQPGDEIVVDGAIKLSPGAAVKRVAREELLPGPAADGVPN